MNDLLAITYGRGQFVAVGANGTVITSPDGIRWTVETTDTNVPLTAVTSSPALFVAAGGIDNKNAVILTSTDGHTWTNRYSAENTSIVALANDGGRYVAVGWTIQQSGDLDGLILVSTDGEDWRRVKSPVQNRLVDILYANGLFLATNGNRILASPDGENWSRQLPEAQAVYQLLYTGTGYFAVGEQTTTPGFPERALYQSPDGETWTPVPVAPSEEIRFSRRLANAPSGYLLLGETARGTGYIMSSPDGINWITRYDSHVPLNGIACGSGRCVTVASFGEIVTSSDGIAWTPLSSGERRDGASIAYGAGKFVITSRTSTQTSTDGVNWTSIPWPDQNNFLGPVIYGGSQFVAISRGNINRALYKSSDGVTWEYAYERSGLAGFSSLAYGNGRYVVTFSNGAGVISSSDLVSWTTSTNLNSGLNDITFGKGLFVGVSEMGMLFTSKDGVNWNGISTGSDGPHLSGVAYDDGLFVAVGTSAGGSSGVILTSRDGTGWTPLSPNPSDPLERVVSGNGRFVAWGPRAIMTSTDGITWTSTPNRAGKALVDMAYGSGRFVAVSSAGPIMSVAVCGSVFPDVPTAHPACAATEQLTERQVISGFPDGSFRPERTVTRAELAKMLVLALGRQPDAQASLPFSDTSGHWAATQGYLQTAVAMKAISGFPDRSFQPDAPVTRSQITKMVAAAAGLSPEGTPPYADIREKDWFSGWVATARRAGLLGHEALNPLWGDRDFQGDRAVTRAEAAMLLDNLRGVQ